MPRWDGYGVGPAPYRPGAAAWYLHIGDNTEQVLWRVCVSAFAPRFYIQELGAYNIRASISQKDRIRIRIFAHSLMGILDENMLLVVCRHVAHRAHLLPYSSWFWVVGCGGGDRIHDSRR